MRKRKIFIAILILLCLLSDYGIMYVQAVNSPINLIERVERYTSNCDEEEILFYLDKGEYQTAIQLVEDSKKGYQERWDYIGLTTNDIYIAYQFKKYMTSEFLSKGWWAKITSWFSALFYNDELKEYLSLQSPGVNKYKEMLIYFMQDTLDELVYKEYIEKLKYSIESIGEANEYAGNIVDLSSEIHDITEGLNIDTYDILYDMFSNARSKKDVDEAVINFVDNNPDFFKNESTTYLFKNGLSKIESKASQLLTLLGAGMEYIDTTISGIMEIDFFIANIEVLAYYEDFLKNIQHTKYDNGNYVAPEDLRIAAEELLQELDGNFSNILTNIINEYGVTTALTGIELSSLLAEGILGEIILGIGIGTMVGNAIFDMESLVKGVSYVQGYAYVGEIYSIILDENKESFLREQTEKSAQQFRKDYEILWHIRLKGEEAYLDMCDFSETWNKDDQKIFKFWTNYENKKQFLDNNIELIKKFEFKSPNFVKKYHDINIDKYLNIFLSTIYQNGLREYDFENYDLSSLLEFAYNISVEGFPYEDGEGNYYYVVPYEKVNDILNLYFGITAPKEQVSNILFKDGDYHFRVLDYGELGMPIVIANDVEQEDNKYKVMFDLVYIWPENFDTGESNPIEDWNIYYDYGINQLKSNSFCEMLGSGYAILERNGENIIVTEFHSDIETVGSSENEKPLTEEEAYKKVEEYWRSVGKNMPEEVEYEGLTEYGHCFWGYNMINGHANTHFRICVDANTGQITVEGGIYH